MNRALWFLALFAAFVVAGARCLCAASVVTASGEDYAAGAALSQAAHAPAEQDPASGGTIDDDSDNAVDALLAPSPARLGLVVLPVVVAGKLSVLCQQGPLQSHTLSLDRPPRV